MPGPVTLDDVAARAGVSRWTVAAAMRGRGRVNAETAKRLKQLAAEMGYDPVLTQAGHNLAEARHGRRARHNLVALALPGAAIDLPFYAQMLCGALLTLAEGGSAPVITDLWRVMWDEHELGRGQRFGTALLRGHVDAAIIHPYDQEAVTRLMEGWRQGRFGDRPVVTLLRRMPGLPCVGVDDRAAVIAAARHLLSLGHREVGCLLWDVDAGDLAERLRSRLGPAGFDTSVPLPTHPIPMEWMSPRRAPHRPGEVTAATPQPETEAALVGWLRANPRITALFVPNDAGALYVIAALRRAGLRVPEDLSLIGADATDDYADGGATRFLATIRPDLVGVGAAAARLALAMVAGEPGADVAIASEFLPGRSLGPARS